MCKKILFTFLFCSISCVLFSQACCAIKYRYIGIITSDKGQVREIRLPATSFMFGYEKKKSDWTFSKYTPVDSVIDLATESVLHSAFCRDAESIIQDVFMKPAQGYPVKIYMQNSRSKKPQEIVLPLETIKFSVDTLGNRRCIVVDLGKISI